MADTIYIKIGQKIRVTQPSVSIGELGDLWCANASIQAHCKALHYTTVYGQRAVGDILNVTQLIQKEYPAVQVENLGETDFIIEYVQERKKRPVWEYTKVVLVCMMIFFGSAFSIMTFNNDVDVGSLFDQIYTQVTGQVSNHFTVLEITYSIGIGLGVLFFFNHFGHMKITTDPTPMQIQMRLYEDDVNKTIIEDIDRMQKK